jgi:anti-repressor protein
MNELIKVNYNGDRQTTSARSLWEFLDKPHGEFMKWFARYSEYGFVENIDYRAIRQKSRTAQGNEYEYTDYEITIDMAKELCMLQKSEKGKIARQYFIELEKRWNSPEMVMARALKMAETKLAESKNTILQLETKLKEQEPLVTFADTCLKSKDNILVRELAKIANDEDINIGEKRLYNKLRSWKIIMPDSTEPYQQYVDKGYFVVEEKPIDTSYGVKLIKTTKVTPKGQVYIIERLKKEFQKHVVVV